MWAQLNAAGMVSGQAYAKGLRTVKTCVGSEWCRFGTQDSTGLGVKLEKFLCGSWTPAKVKLAVSGCPRNCAEATCKDIGIICVESGYDIHIAGAAGLHVQGTELLGHVATEEEAIEASAPSCSSIASRAAISSASTSGPSASASKRSASDHGRPRGPPRRSTTASRFARAVRQNDPWAERAAGRERTSSAPVADLTLREAAE